MARRRPNVIPCELYPNTSELIDQYVDSLEEIAPSIGDHGLTDQQFWDSGIFHAAIERLRGRQAASMKEKRRFIAEILNYMKRSGTLSDWSFTGAGERHDYEVVMPDNRLCVIETKGCLDGNNTNIFVRPANADEFVIWSLCQNPGSDPDKNAWSGIHTRLTVEVIHRREIVDGVIIWDMLCNTAGRPCPKIFADPSRITDISGRIVPPPCIYLLPRQVPDARNNPSPPTHDLHNVSFLQALYDTFQGRETDVTSVEVEIDMSGAEIRRRSRFIRAGTTIAESRWVKIGRAR